MNHSHISVVTRVGSSSLFSLTAFRISEIRGRSMRIAFLIILPSAPPRTGRSSNWDATQGTITPAFDTNSNQFPASPYTASQEIGSNMVPQSSGRVSLVHDRDGLSERRFRQDDAFRPSGRGSRSRRRRTCRAHRHRPARKPCALVEFARAAHTFV